MNLSTKLQIKPGYRVAVLGKPAGLEVALDGEDASAEHGTADAVIAFVVTEASLDEVTEPALAAAREDRLAWIAYPKAGQLGTDLNRDRLARAASRHGVQPVRQISIDETWSALRFRPQKS